METDRIYKDKVKVVFVCLIDFLSTSFVACHSDNKTYKKFLRIRNQLGDKKIMFSATIIQIKLIKYFITEYPDNYIVLLL